MSGKKVVFLYSELAGYIVSCFNALAKRGVEVVVVRWEVNKEAPFQFNYHQDIEVHVRDEFNEESLHQMVSGFNPDLIFVSGWMDKMYTSVTKKFKKKIPVVTGIDNQWYGNIKQRIGSVLSPFMVQNKFTHAFVAGNPQKQFALKLGFKESNIINGLYTADTSLFETYFEDTFTQKKQNFPKRFLYVGRYVEWKGITEMWEAFKEIKEEQNTDWELWCVGTGDMYEERVETEGVKHFGFVQPTELEEIISQSSVFILPSKYEPWGVVTQEYASAGFPILSNKNVGSTSAFLEHGKNGVLINDSSKEELKRGMLELMQKSDAELIEMGERSHELSKKNSPEIWTDNLLSILND